MMAYGTSKLAGGKTAVKRKSQTNAKRKSHKIREQLWLELEGSEDRDDSSRRNFTELTSSSV